MCGIVGIFLKNPALESSLGRLTAGMLDIMTNRGPDSAGFAVYRSPDDEMLRYTLRATKAGEADAASVRQALEAATGVPVAVETRGDHVVARLPAARDREARDAIRGLSPSFRLVSSGSAIELFKGVGRPGDVAARFDLPGLSGTHAIGHTRMATESAVTIAGAHPFSTGLDQCLVHNGSLSNHNALRRRLTREGIEFETENDSEVAAGYLTWRMSEGATLEEALTAGLADLDGFYTFVVGTKSGFGVLRDPVACKPAVMAETDDYVAFGSEYRALVDLPGIEHAHVFEPRPQKVYVWERAA